jgi:hypothetical protein
MSVVKLQHDQARTHGLVSSGGSGLGLGAGVQV